MKIRHTFIVAVLPFMSIAALAAGPADTGPVSRASVQASVIAARVAHQLRPTGDAADYDPPDTSTTSTLTRAQANKAVREARADGELRPAGESEFYAVARNPLTWDRSRAEVRAEVLAARANGELVPAGEGQPLAVKTATASRQSLLDLISAWHARRAAQ